MLRQQGDMLIDNVEEVKGEKQSHLILSESKVTGHKHEVVGKAELFLDGADMYLKVFEVSQLVHEEHKPVELIPGNYKAWKVREWNYFEEKAKEVED
ncbi:MAG: hypothetical protein PHX21_12715 [bacterium]|nr:hypothetical protein [bacterium]